MINQGVFFEIITNYAGQSKSEIQNIPKQDTCFPLPYVLISGSMKALLSMNS